MNELIEWRLILNFATGIFLGGIYWKFRRVCADLDALVEDFEEWRGRVNEMERTLIRWEERYTRWLAKGV